MSESENKMKREEEPGAVGADEPDAKRLKTEDAPAEEGAQSVEAQAAKENIVTTPEGSNVPAAMATALAADIAAAAVAATPSPTTATPSVEPPPGTVAEPTSKVITQDDLAQHERQKAEIQAALEKVKEDNLKKQPSISVLVTQRLWQDEAPQVELALQEIADLSFGNPNAGPNRVTISLTGGLLAIVKALERFSQDPEVLAAGGRALQNLALDQNNKSAIVSAGGITVLVQAMQAFPQHEGVQMGGCGTFQNLVWGNDDNRLNLHKAQGIDALVQAMNLHPTCRQVQEWACGSLYLLSVGEPEIKQALFQSKALTAVAQALENHVGDGSILEKGRNALARLLWQ